jgi:hypothetical protein
LQIPSWLIYPTYIRVIIDIFIVLGIIVSTELGILPNLAKASSPQAYQTLAFAISSIGIMGVILTEINSHLSNNQLRTDFKLLKQDLRELKQFFGISDDK